MSKFATSNLKPRLETRNPPALLFLRLNGEVQPPKELFWLLVDPLLLPLLPLLLLLLLLLLIEPLLLLQLDWLSWPDVFVSVLFENK